MSDNLKSLFEDKKNTDLTILVGSGTQEKYLAHKCILMARSDVFAAMLENEMAEKKSGIIEIIDCDASSFKNFLLFIYTGKIDNLSNTNVVQLYKLAHKYNVQDLKKNCTSFMKRNIDVSNLFNIIILANEFEEIEIMNEAQYFFNKKALKIVKEENWELFMKQNCTLANRLLISKLEADNRLLISKLEAD